MADNILKNGSFILLFGVLSKRHFELSPVWCEYYEPQELDEFDLSEIWIQANLFNRINSSNERAYYSTLENIDYSKREFLNVFCDVVLNGHQLQGYLYVTHGQINSVSIFLNDEVVDFYSSDLLSEDNVETMNDISEHLRINIKNVDSIEYKIKNNTITTIKPDGVFHFSID